MCNCVFGSSVEAGMLRAPYVAILVNILHTLSNTAAKLIAVKTNQMLLFCQNPPML